MEQRKYQSLTQRSIWRFIFVVLISQLLLSCASSSPPKPVGEQQLLDDGGQVYGHITLSEQRIKALRDAFIGRSFVFKEDWYEYSIIDSDPLGGYSDLIPLTRLADWAERKNHRRLIAQKGDVAKIVGTRTYRSEFVLICQLEKSGYAYLIIQNKRPTNLILRSRNINKSVQRDALDEDDINVAWVNHNLRYHTVEFIQGLPEIQDINLDIPAPPKTPTLTPLPVEMVNATNANSLAGIRVATHPVKGTPGGKISLILDYQLQNNPQQTVEVKEVMTLMYQGHVLPGFPKSQLIKRKNGPQRSSIEQHIPSTATSGSYELKGEVCIMDICRSQNISFEIVNQF